MELAVYLSLFKEVVRNLLWNFSFLEWGRLGKGADSDIGPAAGSNLPARSLSTNRAPVPPSNSH